VASAGHWATPFADELAGRRVRADPPISRIVID
jgi:hypothetical protein